MSSALMKDEKGLWGAYWVWDNNDNRPSINPPELGEDTSVYFHSEEWFKSYEKGLEQYVDPTVPAIVVLFQTASTAYTRHDKEYTDVVINYDWLEALVKASGKDILFSKYLELKSKVQVGEYAITHTWGSNEYYTYHYLPLEMFNEYLC